MIRLGELDGESPLEPRQKPLLEVHQIHRGSVGCEDQLLAGLVEVIEYVEERVLGGRPDEFLDVIHDKHVDPHVESHEIGKLVLDVHGIDVLRPEFVAGHIEDDKIRVGLVDGNADRLGQMGLPQAGASENEQRIERGLSEMLIPAL